MRRLVEVVVAVVADVEVAVAVAVAVDVVVVADAEVDVAVVDVAVWRFPRVLDEVDVVGVAADVDVAADVEVAVDVVVAVLDEDLRLDLGLASTWLRPSMVAAVASSSFCLAARFAARFLARAPLLFSRASLRWRSLVNSTAFLVSAESVYVACVSPDVMFP